jgi:pectinesterase
MSLISPLFLVSQGLGQTLPADIVVAQDGSGNFSTVQKALESIPRDNKERVVILIKPGIYEEKVRIDKPFVTLRGANRKTTRIEYPQLDDDFTKSPDAIGKAVVNIESTDTVLENLTVENTAGQIGPHAFAVYGTMPDKTVIIDSDILSEGADTLSLWRAKDGRYYHARCNFRGSVDFVCPRGWCYVTDCNFYECKATAAVWHDGRLDKDMKFVLRNCKFNGFDDFNLARHHADGQFFFLDCSFSKTMRDLAPFRVIYPTNGGPPSEADKKRNKDNDANNIWGERSYFYNCHREGGDYAWFKDNLASAPGSPKAEQVTAAWTFAGKWDPENAVGPKTKSVDLASGKITMTFSEPVTVKGKPRLALSDSGYAEYSSGSGTDAIVFSAVNGASGAPKAIVANGAWIVASGASAKARPVELDLSATTRP